MLESLRVALLKSSLALSTQVHVAVSRFKIKLYLDCKKIAEKPINTVGSISTAGFIMLGKVTRTRGPRSGSASVSPRRGPLWELGA